MDAPVEVDHDRERADRPDVRRDVVARGTVAARGAADEAAALVDEVDREPVDLQVGRVLDRVRLEPFADARVPLLELFERVGVLDREHRRVVRRRRKLGVRLASDARRRRVGARELRVLLLERLQLAHQLVEVVVRDLGRSVDVVEPLVAPDLGAEGFDLLLHGCGCWHYRAVLGSSSLLPSPRDALDLQPR